MGWNYRVVRHRNPLPKDKIKLLREAYPDGYVEFYAIHEVYYNKKGKPDGMTENAITVQGDDIKSMKWSLNKMRLAFKKPVLDYKTLKEIK